jgi:asparagine synthase (glutamine-hydrolysing)
VVPDVPDLDLEPALLASVALRREGGMVALSGGVDSALLAAFAGLPCITVGMEGSPDFTWAERVAYSLGLPHRQVVIAPEEADRAIPPVLQAIPRKSPLDLSIALTLFFVCRAAAEDGFRRVLCGQGADELFAGYARHRESSDLASDLRRDFSTLHAQAVRDQAVARLHGTCLSYPYLDPRVVRAAGRIPAGDLVAGGVGKRPLRAIAARHLPAEVAGRGKKAMQYGSGIWRHLRRRARENGYKRSVQGYLDGLAGGQ